MYFLPPLLLFLLAAGGALATAWVDAWWFLPFLISAFLIGLPHGAADWGVLRRLVARGNRTQSLIGVGIYCALLAASALLVFVTPPLGLTIFLLVSAWHFGGADAHDFGGHFHLKGRRKLLRLTAGSRGVLIVTSPFVFRFADMFGTCEAWCAMLNSSWISPVYSDIFRVIVVSSFILSALAAGTVMSILLSAGRPRAAGWLALETLILVATFALLHPLFALGAYFLCWHSMRHLSHIRILGDSKAGLGWLYRLSGPFFVPSLVVIGLLAWGTGGLFSPERIAIILLIFFAIVTPAHQWLVSRELQAPVPTA
ncbi:MAG: hypothetical protein CMP28_13095 [Roseibacillus sp.]|nr:hypothetical protein [Roseibacillus sp.]